MKIDYIQNLITPINNCESMGVELCKAMGVRITRTNLIKEITEHPDYPSLLSISDVLASNGVENVALKTSTEKLSFLATPFIIQIQTTNHDFLFAVVYEITENTVAWINPETGKRENITFNQLKAQYTGFVLVAQPTELAGDVNYKHNYYKEKWNYLWKIICILLIPAGVLGVLLYTSVVEGFSNSLFPNIYVMLSLCGMFVSMLLLLYETGWDNMTLQKVCTVGRHTSCKAVLNSQSSRIGGINWSVIGFSYFGGGLLAQITTGVMSHDILIVSALLSTLALFYTIYSIYYQGLVIKQWCTLCLVVQGILVLQFVVALIGGFFVDIANLEIRTILFYATMVAVVFLLANSLMFGLQKNKSSKYYFKALQRLKHDSSVFGALLIKQNHISEVSSELGIILGNPEGHCHIVKVCNPYCTPCAMVHPILDSIVESNPQIRLQIIFTVAADNSDVRNKPVKLFLALQESHQDVREALANWFKLENKDYDEFARQYSVSNNLLNTQINKIERMRDWCIKTKIKYTPTIFLNNYQLPDIYTVTDLRYFFSV